MRKGVKAACALATAAGLLAAGCGGGHRPGPVSGGYAQPSSAEPEPSSPSAESPGSPEPSASPEPRSEPPAEAPPVSSAPPSAGPLEIRARETRFGRILVDGRGMTIYVSAKDNADFESTCSAPCTGEWPPLYTNGQVTAGPGVNSAWLGTIGRSDGPTQVEYNGWPLYYSTRDTRPGDIKGQGVASNGTTWHVIDADRGKKVK
jgi:predicted lipoprotein with Yx(FWY)xxD motif